MPTLNSLVPLVRMHVRNCPDPVIEDALLFQAREFCRRTRWLRESIILPVTANTNAYSLTATLDPSTTEVIGVKAAEWNGEPIEPKTQEEVADNVFGFYYYEPPADLILSWFPAEDDATALEVRLILQVMSNVSSLPEALTRRWDAGLSYGAIFRLATMKDAAYYDPQGAALFGSMWEKCVSDAQVEADRQHTMQGFRVRSYS